MMCGARRFGRWGKRIPGRQSGFLAGRVKRNISKRAGFTLIELLVVISIIALLLAILLPVVQKVQAQARAVVCQSNLRQWGTALSLYVEDSQGRFPRTHATEFFRYSLRGEGNQRLEDVDIRGILLCPAAVRHSVLFLGTRFNTWTMKDNDGSWFQGSYGFNEFLLDARFDASIPFPPREGIDIFSLRGRANIPTLLDSTSAERTFYDISPPPDYEGEGPYHPFCINRHNGHINGLFLDWSVRKIGLKELWTLKWTRDFDTANKWTKAGGAMPEDWPVWMRNFKDY